jgi:4-amino-4-deoxy-L-arabinose transferase-like glycosyltransferase
MRTRLVPQASPGHAVDGGLARAHGRSGGRLRLRTLRLPAPELGGLLVLAAVLNLWALAQNGWANQYYSAAVRSMSTNWHAFLYGSFDAGGVMTVDKPPLALWVQALSVRIFGYHSLSVLVPQALMGVATVALVYDLTRRCFGRVAGFAAGLTLALTPITVAISRHNNPDALLVLCCVAAVWCLVRAFEDGRTRWLVWAGVAVGLGFETKMAVALMVVPGIAAAWLWMAPRGRGRALRQLLAGGAAMTVVGMAWPVLVALTPAADRPWISGTSDNSIWSLILGYNGLGRLSGQSGGPGAVGGGGGGGANANFGGSAGPLRLLNQALGGQAGWLLGFAVVAGIAIVVATRLRRTDMRSGWLIAVGGAFATIAIGFSFAQGIFHPYYVSLLAPFGAALVGGGVALLRAGDVRARVFGPLALLAGGGTEIAVLSANSGQLSWLPPVLVLVLVPAAAVLAATGEARWRNGALATAFAVLLIAPASWSMQTLGHPTSGTFPAGGPASASMGGGPGGFGGGRGRFAGGPPAGGAFGAQTGAPTAGAPPAGAPTGTPPAGAATGGRFGGGRAFGGGFGGGGAFGGNSAGLNTAVAYAKAHGGGTVAVSSQEGASGSIISSGANVAAIGGFSGKESEVSVSWFANEVQAGNIRWVIGDSGGGGMPQDSRVGASKVLTAVAQTCKKITTNGVTLYDCQGQASALRALS